MRSLWLVLACGCGSAARPIPRSPVATTTDHRIFRQLRVGRLHVATQTTFELVLDGDRASLVETDARASRALPLAEADRDASWTITAQRTYRGTAAAGDLDLASDGVQPLHLHCAARTVDAATAGAQRVASPDRPADDECGDRGVWAPATTTRVAALVCDARAADPDDDDDDRLVFADAPGLEYVEVNDDCVLQGGGLRVTRSR